MENFENDFKELVKKNLPAHIGEALQEKLKQADKDAKALDAASIELSELRITKNELTSELNKHIALNTRSASLDVREATLREAEVTKEVTELKIRLEESDKRAETITEITRSLVRNTTFRESLFSTKDVVTQDNNGFATLTPTTATSNKTTEAD